MEERSRGGETRSSGPGSTPPGAERRKKGELGVEKRKEEAGDLVPPGAEKKEKGEAGSSELVSPGENLFILIYCNRILFFLNANENRQCIVD